MIRNFDDLSHVYSSDRLPKDVVRDQKDLRAKFMKFALSVNDLPEGRAAALMMTHLEEAMFWGLQAISVEYHSAIPGEIQPDPGH